MTVFLKNVDFFAGCSEKSGPHPEKYGPRRVIFWKMWSFMNDFQKTVVLNLKRWIFMHDFLKNVDLNLYNVDHYVWYSEKCGPQPEKYGHYKWLSENVEFDLKNIDLYILYEDHLKNEEKSRP